VQFYFLYGVISGDALTMYMNFITHEDLLECVWLNVNRDGTGSSLMSGMSLSHLIFDLRDKNEE
jgi:hypothetical protein